MRLPTREPFTTLLELKGNGALLPLYAGVACGARKSLDDWIPLRALAAFRQCLDGLGLAMIEDCIFERLPIERRIDGLAQAPTTHARGLPMQRAAEASPEARVHVFVAGSPRWAEEALRAFSYPVAIPEDRLLIRPRIDATRVGAAFGYPPCCIAAFMRWNNWFERSHFSVVYRSQRVADWQVNCLPRNTPFMAIFHAPCSASCTASFRMSQQVVEAVAEFDSEYAESIVASLKGEFLIVNEAVVYKLHGAEVDGEMAVSFREAESLIGMRSVSRPQVAKVARLLDGADWLELDAGLLTVRGEGEERYYEVDPTSGWVDDPCLIRFQ